MAAIVARPPSLPRRAQTPPLQLTLNTSSKGFPTAIPNKHLPICSPGPRPAIGLETPPASPPTKESILPETSILSAPERYRKLCYDPTIYSIDADTLAEAIDQIATQSMPEAKDVFPWLHGLHAENNVQLSFFTARRKSLRKTPTYLRGLTVLKADGDLTKAKLKGTVAPGEILCPDVGQEDKVAFLELDPREGFSVRNFHIQTCKMATVSDIVVYGDEEGTSDGALAVAKRLARAQTVWREKQDPGGRSFPLFNTFVLSAPYTKVEVDHPEIVATDSKGCVTGKVMDFFFWERFEMYTMSMASEIATNVWLGPTPDPNMCPPGAPATQPKFDLLIEASDMAVMPDTKTLSAIESMVNDPEHDAPQLEFPSSGSIMPPTWSQAEVDGLMETLQWIHRLANAGDAAPAAPSEQKDADGDSTMQHSSTPPPPSPPTPRKILLHCVDGYTETSLLALAYLMYAEGLSAPDAWLTLHRAPLRRNFFAYATDVALLTTIQPRILAESPSSRRRRRTFDSIVDLAPAEPAWLARMDGSLPSRVLDYLYLGNLGHANNPELLRELGIGQVLSVGEMVAWGREACEAWGAGNVMFVDRVQDNGVDPLTGEFERCLAFIARGRRNGTATLVHCRVGVSRSATICIAEIMRELGLSFPRAYCFVRARRLNVIIQPHLRFAYELLKWEETQQQKRGQPLRREVEWATVAREIALMNQPYTRQS